jgi:TM2 domain-containing membrane protein YozV
MLKYVKHIVFIALVGWGFMKADQLIRGEGLINSILLITVFFGHTAFAYYLFYVGWGKKENDN